VNRYTEPATLRRDEAEMIQRLAARRLIDRAKGLLMSRKHMTEPEAFRWLQRAAMDRRMPMQIVATNVIATFSD
jgi:AmiR/NasT family two-component response regulator